MVDRNRPLAKSYRQSQEEESDEQDEEETMETDSGQESSPPPVRELLMNFIYFSMVAYIVSFVPLQ